MRRKRERPATIPARYRRYRPEEWDGPGQWIAERERWAKAQSAIVITGADYCGMPWRCLVTPLGDATDLMRTRREARMTAFAGLLLTPIFPDLRGRLNGRSAGIRWRGQNG